MNKMKNVRSLGGIFFDSHCGYVCAQSLANACKDTPCFAAMSTRSAVYTMNNNGLRTDPCIVWPTDPVLVTQFFCLFQITVTCWKCWTLVAWTGAWSLSLSKTFRSLSAALLWLACAFTVVTMVTADYSWCHVINSSLCLCIAVVAGTPARTLLAYWITYC